MPTPPRPAAALAALLLLGSWSHAHIVRVAFAGGQLTFFSDDGGKMAHAPWCLTRFAVFAAGGEIVWEFEEEEIARAGSPCAAPFPLAYGREPAGTRVLIGPLRLEPDRLYVIEGDGGGRVAGAFSLSRAQARIRLRNLDPASADVAAAKARNRAWREAHEARWSPPSAGPDRELLQPDVLTVPTGAESGPSGVDDRTWLVHESDSGLPSLSYGRIDGTGIAVEFSCRWRGAIIIGRTAPWSGGGTPLQLESGRYRVALAVAGSGASGHSYRGGLVAPESHALLRQFGLTGQLSIRIGDRGFALNAVDARERRAVRYFFELCHGAGELPWGQRRQV